MLPSIQEYIDSFRETTDYFKTLKLQSVPSKFDANEPYFIAGGFACVFKVKQDNQFWAFKCFLQEDKHRNERLKILSEFLQQRTENYFIKTHYYTNELWVCSQLAGDAEYPTLAMPWIEGLTLGEYVHKAAKERNTDALQTIYDEFLRLAHFLLTNDFAHGDLKHDNILVTQDQNLILIDYDGMYLPELAHISSQELGGHAYQHPKRTAQDWGKHIDDFSILVILLSLRAFIVLPSLIENHHTENLLLTDKDLQNPMQSQTIQLLWQQNDEPLKHLLGMLLNSLSQNNLRVLEIFGFVERNLFEMLNEFYIKSKYSKEVFNNFSVNDNLPVVNHTPTYFNEKIKESYHNIAPLQIPNERYTVLIAKNDDGSLFLNDNNNIYAFVITYKNGEFESVKPTFITEEDFKYFRFSSPEELSNYNLKNGTDISIFYGKEVYSSFIYYKSGYPYTATIGNERDSYKYINSLEIQDGMYMIVVAVNEDDSPIMDKHKRAVRAFIDLSISGKEGFKRTFITLEDFNLLIDTCTDRRGLSIPSRFVNAAKIYECLITYKSGYPYPEADFN